MNRYLMTIAAAALAGGVALASSPAGAGAWPTAARPAGTWGTAKELPGSASLNAGGQAAIFSVSCASAADCSAGGYYANRAGHPQAMVDTETNGRWGNAEELPGTATLDKGGDGAEITSVSCASPGNCSAGGEYTNSAGHTQALVATQARGAWGKAVEVPGTGKLNTGGDAVISSVSCASAGDCSAGGYYDNSGRFQAFVVTEADGAWGKAVEVPGTGKLNTGGHAVISSVSCASAGDCSAGGYYTGNSGHQQAFVVSQVTGRWQNAEEVPGTARLNSGGLAAVDSVSCASPGNCSAGGSYYESSGYHQAFVVSQVSGSWNNAEEVPGTARLNKGGVAQISAVSCASPGNCSAGGDYTDNSDYQQAFVVSQASGTWGTAEEVPGTATLNKGGLAVIASVSCASAGNCSAGGDYASSLGRYQAFVVSQASGTWGTAEEVPGTATLNKGSLAAITSVSCASAGECSAGGYYRGSYGRLQAFTDSQG